MAQHKKAANANNAYLIDDVCMGFDEFYKLSHEKSIVGVSVAMARYTGKEESESTKSGDLRQREMTVMLLIWEHFIHDHEKRTGIAFAVPTIVGSHRCKSELYLEPENVACEELWK